MLVTRKEGVMDSDRVKGKLKETEGKLTGDKAREGQGKAESTWGETKDKARDLRDEAKQKTR
jgi:uncharacterized protein YjbJ (UPF0337 family)